VRYLIGQHDGKPTYRACLIKSLCLPTRLHLSHTYRVVTDLGAQLVAPYKLEDEMVNQQLELAIGDSVKAVNMDRVSNAEIHLYVFIAPYLFSVFTLL
jgi:RNA polymerase-associated protein RTF1